MSAGSTGVPMVVERLRPVALAMAILGLVGVAIGYGMGKETAMQGYMYGFLFWMCVTLGCLGLTILLHTIRASWGIPVLRMFEAGGGVAALVLMAILFVPIALQIPAVFPWASTMANDHIVHLKALYLNQPFFLARAALYFVLWLIWAYFLRKWSLAQDQDPSNSDYADKRVNLASPGLVMFVVTVNFAMTDWAMSLEPKYFSTVFGLLMVVGQALAALSLATCLAIKSAGEKPYSDVMSPQMTKDLGNMLFALTMLWAYLTLSQFLITWAANLPEEIPYYLRRNHAGWNIVGAIILLGQFFIPFFALLAPKTKRVMKILVWVVSLIFVIRLVDIFWVVMPGLRTSGFAVSWVDVAAWVGIGGLWFSVFASQLRKANLLPAYDPRVELMKESLEHA